MDRYAKAVYEFILSQEDHEFIYQMYSDQIPGGADRFHDFKKACHYLERSGYAVVKSPGMVSLTHEGIHKRELEIRAFWRSFFMKWLPGFISGVIAGVLINLSTDFVQQWLLQLNPLP